MESPFKIKWKIPLENEMVRIPKQREGTLNMIKGKQPLIT
jgi:hypothetical protein